MNQFIFTCVLFSSAILIQINCTSHQNGQILYNQFQKVLGSSSYTPDETGSTLAVARSFPSPLAVPPPLRTFQINEDQFYGRYPYGNLGILQQARSNHHNNKNTRSIMHGGDAAATTTTAGIAKKKYKKKKPGDDDEEDVEEPGSWIEETDDKIVKGLYKLSFYFNPGWYARHPELPSGPGPVYPGEYFPNPQYGVVHVQHLPPPLPPPLSKSISPLVSNFGGYVGPIVYDDEEGLLFEDPKYKIKV